MIGADDIDALLAAEKHVVGRPPWEKSRETTVRLKAALRIRDEIVGGLFLVATASVHQTPQHGSLVLVYQDRVIERMDVLPTSPHTNPLKNVPRHLRGATLAAGDHQYHPWSLNRRWPRSSTDELPVAEPVNEPLESFGAAIHYFCVRTGIAGDVPLPPHEPGLGL